MFDCFSFQKGGSWSVKGAGSRMVLVGWSGVGFPRAVRAAGAMSGDGFNLISFVFIGKPHDNVCVCEYIMVSWG